MKHLLTSVILITILLSSPDAQAQRRWMSDRPAKVERLDKFRKMRMIEVLKLNEEQSVRFFAKQSAHQEKVRALMKDRNDALDSIEESIRDESEKKDPSKLTEKIMEIDKNVFAERQRYQNEMRQFLTPVQFGKFIVFERNFGKQVRDALEDMHQERRERHQD